MFQIALEESCENIETGILAKRRVKGISKISGNSNLLGFYRGLISRVSVAGSF